MACNWFGKYLGLHMELLGTLKKQFNLCPRKNEYPSLCWVIPARNGGGFVCGVYDGSL